MVVKSELKLIKSLQQKKYRTQHGLFIVEGVKAVEEVLNSDFEVHKVYATASNELDVSKHILTPVSAKGTATN